MAKSLGARALEHGIRQETIDGCEDILFRCGKCNQLFGHAPTEGGRLPRNWWKCPNGCNA